MIKIYPNAFAEGEPLETHEATETMSVAAWLSLQAPAFSMQRETHPINITIDGVQIEPHLWDVAKIHPDSDVVITVQPKGLIAAIVVAVIAVVASVAMALLMKPKIASTQQKQQLRGRSLDGAEIDNNTPAWGDPIPDVAGSPRIYPPVLVPQYSIFPHDSWENPAEITKVTLCIGVGEFDISLDDIRIGDTPIAAFGDKVTAIIYKPGDDMSPDGVLGAGRWYHTCEEVGYTSLAGSGLSLGVESMANTTWSTSNVDVTGAYTIQSVGGASFFSDWTVGKKLEALTINQPVTVSIAADGITRVLSGPQLDRQFLSVGDRLTIDGETVLIQRIIPASGVSVGQHFEITGDGPPDRLDFGTTPLTFYMAYGGFNYPVVVSETAADVDALAAILKDVLFYNLGLPINVSVVSGAIVLSESLATPIGVTPVLSGQYKPVFGGGITTVNSQVPSSGGDARYEVAGGLYFSPSTMMRAVKILDEQYIITYISGDRYTMSVDLVGHVGAWDGFDIGNGVTVSTPISLIASDRRTGWTGPFRVTPPGEKIDRIQVDISWPNGLISYNNAGDPQFERWEGQVAITQLDGGYALVDNIGYSAKTPNQFGHTYQYDVPEGEYEVAVTAITAPSEKSNVSNKAQWVRLKGRIPHNHYIYPDMTTLFVSMHTGDAVSGQVQNKISVRAKRKLPTLADPSVLAYTRNIAPYFVYMMGTVGYDRSLIDMDRVNEYDAIWQAKNQTFDVSFAGSTTLKQAANHCLGAGFAELTVRNGLITPVLNVEQVGLPTRVLSPHEYTEPLEQTIRLPQPDDVDGVDAEYVDYATGKKATVQYRLPGDLGHRVEKIKLIGITSKLHAWRAAARQRRERAYNVVRFTGETELQAMNLGYRSFVGLQDGLPEWGQSAFIVDIITPQQFLMSEEIRSRTLSPTGFPPPPPPGYGGPFVMASNLPPARRDFGASPVEFYFSHPVWGGNSPVLRLDKDFSSREELVDFIRNFLVNNGLSVRVYMVDGAGICIEQLPPYNGTTLHILGDTSAVFPAPWSRPGTAGPSVDFEEYTGIPPAPEPGFGGPFVFGGTAPPSRLDFGDNPTTFYLAHQVFGGNLEVTLNQNFTSPETLAAHLQTLLGSQGLAVRCYVMTSGPQSGHIAIVQVPPYDGSLLTASGAYQPVFGGGFAREGKAGNAPPLATEDLYCAIRNGNGTVSDLIQVTNIEGRVVTLATPPAGVHPAVDNSDATVIYFGELNTIYMPAIITEIQPKADNKTRFEAIGYDSRIYADDNGSPE